MSSPPAKRAKEAAAEEGCAGKAVEVAPAASAVLDGGGPAVDDLGGGPSTHVPAEACPEGYKYEYLDHTADIQIHSWGATLNESMEQVVMGMFGYMTELPSVTIDEAATNTFDVEGHDMPSLLYNLMDEFLFRFSCDEFFVPKEVKVLELDTEHFKIKVQGKGEAFDLAKHPQGTEIKAITYSNMQIHNDRPTHDIYVIVDI